MTAETERSPSLSVVPEAVPEPADPGPLAILMLETPAGAGPGLGALLEAHGGLRVCRTDDEGAALALLAAHRWDLIIVDPALPHGAESLLSHARDGGIAALVLKAHGPQPILAAVDAGDWARRARARGQRRVLAIGAHPDDVEIGCGGTLAWHGAEGDRLHILTLSRGAAGGDIHVRTAEAQRAAEILGATLQWGNLPDTRIDDGFATIEIIQSTIEEVRPTHVYTHCAEDTHQDHRAVHAASLVAARAVANLYCYEASSSTAAFQPNHFIDISDHLERKLAAAAAYGSQRLRVAALREDVLRARAIFWGHRGGGARLVEPMRVVHQRIGRSRLRTVSPGTVE